MEAWELVFCNENEKIVLENFGFGLRIWNDVRGIITLPSKGLPRKETEIQPVLEEDISLPVS